MAKVDVKGLESLPYITQVWMGGIYPSTYLILFLASRRRRCRCCFMTASIHVLSDSYVSRYPDISLDNEDRLFSVQKRFLKLLRKKCQTDCENLRRYDAV